MLQPKNKAWCSAAAVHNALRAVGLRVGMSTLANRIGVDDLEGADEHDILQALTGSAVAVAEFYGTRKQEARDWLRGAYNYPLILCVDSWEHWVCVAGGCGDRLFLLDSVREPWNEAQGGVWPLKANTILKRWKAAKRVSGKTPYYGIAVWR